jgi:hypothetical protein
MDRQHQQDPREKDVPSKDEGAARQGEENRRDMDERSKQGTDPLYEGP